MGCTNFIITVKEREGLNMRISWVQTSYSTQMKENTDETTLDVSHSLFNHCK